MVELIKGNYEAYEEKKKENDVVDIFIASPEDQNSDTEYQLADILKGTNNDKLCLLMRDTMNTKFMYEALRLSLMNLKTTLKTEEGFKGKKNIIINRIQFLSDKEMESFILTFKDVFYNEKISLSVFERKYV